ncbi:MAG TPA: hypothetical protein VIH18_22715 [Candidatus Binatia bacterium]|jgi:hypothetical protein
MPTKFALQYLPSVLLFLVVAGLPPRASAAQSVKTKPAPAKERPAVWLLAGREGECAPLSLLEKKGSEFRGIESPDHLAQKMRAAGHKVEIKEHNLASRPAVEVRVPERGLYVMFVKAELCAKMEAAESAKKSKAEEQKRKP